MRRGLEDAESREKLVEKCTVTGVCPGSCGKAERCMDGRGSDGLCVCVCVYLYCIQPKVAEKLNPLHLYTDDCVLIVACGAAHLFSCLLMGGK